MMGTHLKVCHQSADFHVVKEPFCSGTRTLCDDMLDDHAGGKRIMRRSYQFQDLFERRKIFEIIDLSA